MKIKIITCTAVEKDGKFLVLKRAENHTMPGLWEFPGGKVEPKEKLEKSAIREVFEETGLKTDNLKYSGYSERIYEDRQVHSDFHTIVHHFYTNQFEGNLKTSEEHTDYKWLTKEEILSMKKSEEIGTDSVSFFSL